MNTTLSPSVSRALAAALLLGALLVLAFGIAAPLFDSYASARDEQQRLAAAIEHARAATRDPAALPAELARLRAEPHETIGVLASSSEALAVVELQDKLKASVAAANAVLQSTQVLPARDEEKLRRIAIHAEIAAGIESAQSLIYTLETASPLLFLDNVAIEHSGSALQLRFDVAGFMRRAES